VVGVVGVESAAVAEFQFCLLLFVPLRVVLLLLLDEIIIIIVKIDERSS